MGTGDAAVTRGTQEAPGRGRARETGPAPACGGRGRRGSARPARAAAIGAAAAVGGALLFLGYLRVSWTVAATSDGAAQALQARDMLAGNWLLHGWTLSDVSFYTTELPEYVLVEVIRPFGLGVIHIAAAATYTMLVLAVFALAYGRAGGREGIARGVLATVIMLAPQLGYGAFVLLLAPDHTGTELPAAARLAAARPRAAPLVGARDLVPAAGRGPVRRPGRAADRGAAADRRVHGDPGAPTPATSRATGERAGRVGPGPLVRARADRGRDRFGRGFAGRRRGCWRRRAGSSRIRSR